MEIESYINNLHPVEQIFERFIPLLNKVLSDLVLFETKPNRIAVDAYSWYEGLNIGLPKHQGSPRPKDTRLVITPDVGQFQMKSPPTNINIDLRGRKLQVIVKLANTILTPDKPNCPGGV